MSGQYSNVSCRECWYILEGRDWSQDEDKMHFESGVRMGVGAFNLVGIIPSL